MCCRRERDSLSAPFKTNLGRVRPGRDFTVCSACGSFSREFEIGEIAVLCSVFKRVCSCVRLCHVFSLRYFIACSG